MQTYDDNFFGKIPMEIEKQATEDFLRYILETVTDGEKEFDHLFMTAGEQAIQILEQTKICENTGIGGKLRVSREKISSHLEKLEENRRPLLEDCVAVSLCVATQYDKHPNRNKSFWDTVEFAPQLQSILKDIGLIRASNKPHPNFVPYLLDNAMLVLDQDKPNPEISAIVSDVALNTWLNAPKEFKKIINERRGKITGFHYGLWAGNWRYGRWLTKAEITRKIELFNCLIDGIVIDKLYEILIELGELEPGPIPTTRSLREQQRSPANS
ncbi:hypothetical protein SAMN05444141_105435 [Pseudovibrio denitrificans]|uniref:Uncharacterized protein n=1 Tax=Pseudovibrio denitrificans TaxID=258256 RepID=A0A1I7CCE7_9HYPH|nr:hypothetical protein [Pseudovibrio denitrificans]SFT97099.1 hypothetical protein SAMN05444141_105435 [Pseudovibrio denitrificans]